MIHTASRLNAEAAEDTGHGALFQCALSVGPGEVFGILGRNFRTFREVVVTETGKVMPVKDMCIYTYI